MSIAQEIVNRMAHSTEEPSLHLSDAELAEIEERYKKASKGPWFSYEDALQYFDGIRDNEIDCIFRLDPPHYTDAYPFTDELCPEPRLDILCSGVITKSDQEFIAHAITDIPKLLEYIKILKETKHV